MNLPLASRHWTFLAGAAGLGGHFINLPLASRQGGAAIEARGAAANMLATRKAAIIFFMGILQIAKQL